MSLYSASCHILMTVCYSALMKWACLVFDVLSDDIPVFPVERMLIRRGSTGPWTFLMAQDGVTTSNCYRFLSSGIKRIMMLIGAKTMICRQVRSDSEIVFMLSIICKIEINNQTIWLVRAMGVKFLRAIQLGENF